MKIDKNNENKIKNSLQERTTYMFFPVGTNKNTKKGIALLIAMVCISVMTLFSADFILNSQLSLTNSVAQRDGIKAEFLAKSGINLSHFLITADLAIDLVMKDSGMSSEPTDSSSDIWSLANSLPIGGGSTEIIENMQEQFDLSLIQDDKVIETLKQFDGEFASIIEDEQSKINVNFLSEGLGTEVKAAMKGLMEGCPSDQAFLKDQNITADKLIARIKDWVDPDTNPEPASGLSDEDSVYKKLEPPYVPLNAQFDTIDQLKLIDQWNDDIHTVYSPYLTVYPYQQTGFQEMKININTASKELMGCLFPKSKTDCKTKYEALYKDISENSSVVASSDSEIQSKLQSDFCSSETSSISSSMFTTRSDTFRIRTVAYVGDYKKEIEEVIQRKVPDENDKNASSYELLYWK